MLDIDTLKQRGLSILRLSVGDWLELQETRALGHRFTSVFPHRIARSAKTRAPVLMVISGGAVPVDEIFGDTPDAHAEPHLKLGWVRSSQAVATRDSRGLLEEIGSPKPLRIAFEARPRAGFLSIHRAHPLPGVLAETFLERALDKLSKQDDPACLPRCGVWECEGIETVLALLLIRIRHRIDSRGRLGPQFAMAEEAAAIAFDMANDERHLAGEGAFALLEAPSANVVDRVRDAQLARASRTIIAWKSQLDAYAAERAEALADDHSRVRQALGSRGAVRVEAVTPVDIVGLYVLMPQI